MFTTTTLPRFRSPTGSPSGAPAIARRRTPRTPRRLPGRPRRSAHRSVPRLRAAPFALQGEGKVPHAPFRAEQISDAGFAHALLGHFHTPTEAPTHTYPGNPDPLTFGETGQRGAVLLHVAGDGTISRQRFAVASSEVHDVTVDLSGVTHSDEVIGRVRDAVASSSGVARVTLTGEVGPDVDLRLQDIATARPAHLDALLPRLASVRVGYDVDHRAKSPRSAASLFRDVLADTTLSDDQRRKVLITGLRSLDGRRDELEVH